MVDFLFYIFSALTLLSALLVVTSRNAVNAAMALILCLAGISSLFVLLGAYFLAVLQLLVYAGAVVVLFLFIIMLLDVDASDQTFPNTLTLLASGIGLLLLVMGTLTLFGQDHLPALSLSAHAAASSSRNFGYELFTKYMLPFQVAGFMLLISMIGVIVLSKRVEPESIDQSEA